MTTEVLVAGAGPAGLAVGAALRKAGIEGVLLEREWRVGGPWRNHYERLHLHTARRLSNLPGLQLPRRHGRWVPRDGVARYLEDYARHHRLRIRFGVHVERFDLRDGAWSVTTSRGAMEAPFAVVATGYNRVPHDPGWAGLEGFTGRFLHSSVYRSPGPFRGRDVLVVGTGNSGAEISVDLAHGGASRVRLAVRTPPTIFPRQALGVPSQVLGVLLGRLPPRIVDRLVRPLQRLLVGDLSRYGLPTSRRAYSQFLETDVVPILDVGLIDALKTGRVEVVPAVEGFDGADVLLSGGPRVRPEVVIAATGFRRGLEPLVGHLGILTPGGRPAAQGPDTHPNAPRMHFIGYTNPIGGNLRQLGIDARKIVRAISRSRTRPPARPRTATVGT